VEDLLGGEISSTKQLKRKKEEEQGELNPVLLFCVSLPIGIGRLCVLFSLIYLLPFGFSLKITGS